MNLNDLALKYGSDKADHNYCPFYEMHLPKNPRKILEIGVKDGASIQMWHEYYPNAEIHGLDLFSEKSAREILDKCFAGTDKITFHTGNQCDWLLLEQLRKHDFDVIIDDGGHLSRAQLITFFGLYNGKHYFIEDLHCADEEFYRDGLPIEVTAKSVFKNAVYGDNNKIVLIHA